ncbi:ArnT family glycosyltransferase [Mobilicoccus pelagius]|uniref:Uncharacterized protein n=1 Tax=Mobilicoccus pelagius NBRC 104925 TaxID=1089455 RepID=H5UW68_9MICO|nr:glycosyltransferase family 39 protein [Mobilicoccus pelagius]GAB49976.1 hypothetical protein MOPEL_135_02140 [Mobilicoccus pelagius NBRC 104925]
MVTDTALVPADARSCGVLARTRDVLTPRPRLRRAAGAGEASVTPDAATSTTAGGSGATPAASAHSGLRTWPTWEKVSLAALLLGTLAFWLYGLSANGYANSFYSAAVQAGSQSWTAMFFGSSDAANSITVDKPPASLWVMALSVRLFGLNPWAILVPEVLMGVGTVAILYAAVRRHGGHVAGLLAGLVLAVTPVATLMFRFNNPDALLVLLLTAATAAMLRAVEKACGRRFALVGMLLGFAFLTKTLQAFLVLPVLGLVYLVCAPTTLRHRVVHSLGGLAAMLVAGGWWVAIVELLPASMRPYIGGSQTNSFLDLTFGYNGLGRINGDEAGSVGPNSGTQSILRLFSSSVGGQISWLIPTALVFLAVGLWVTRRAPRTDLRRVSYLLWGGWLVVTGLVFSLMAGIFHEYYTVALAPAVAALVGVGAVDAWRRVRSQDVRWGSVTLSVATAAASVWGFVLLTRVADQAYGPLRYVVLTLGLSCALLLLVTERMHRRFVPVVLAGALLASLAGPTAYSVSTVSHGYSGSIVTAGPTSGMGPGGAGGGPGGGTPPQARGATGSTTGSSTSTGTAAAGSASTGSSGTTGATTGSSSSNGSTTGTAQSGSALGGLLNAGTPSEEVVAALQADADSYTWAAAAIGSQNSAGLQLASGEPVMAIGGFNGSDPSPKLAQFQWYVANGRIHWFAASGQGAGPGIGGTGTAAKITAWVTANYTAVTIDGATFYDLTQPLSPTTTSTTTGTTGTTTTN